VITLPAKFAAENEKAESAPVVLVKLGNSNLENIQSSQGDWEANTAETQVDYATQQGDVLIESDATPGISQVSDDSTQALVAGATINVAWQSFLVPTSGDAQLLIISSKYSAVSIPAGNLTIYCQIYDAKEGSAVSSELSQTFGVSSPAGTAVKSFDFTSLNVVLDGGTTYWIKFRGTGLSNGTGSIHYDSAKPYADGQLDITGAAPSTDIGDAYFTATFDRNYYLTSGSITSQTIDMGETPTVDGEWKMVDQTPDDYGTTTLTYTAYGHTSDNFGAATTIGTVEDGDPIESGDWYRYYWLKADFTTTDESESPILESMGASFVSYINFQNHLTELLYEPSVKTVSSLTTTISDFDNSTVGQMSVTIGQTEQISNYFYSIVAKNKPAKILLGFNVSGFEESDYINFYSGVIDDFKMSGRDFSINIKDNSTNWNFKVPREISTAGSQSGPTYQTDITAAADHHADVMLDILQNYLSVRDSTIDIGSFEATKSSTPGWVVTRTIAGEDAEKASEFINQLRILLGAYFIPQANGQIKIKVYDSDEATIDDVTLNMPLKRPDYNPELGDLINKTLVSWDWDTGDEEFDALFIGIDEDSQSNTGESFDWEFEDYWTIPESTDLDLWTQFESVDDSTVWLGITYGDKWVMAGPGLYGLAYSYNGYDWVQLEAPQPANPNESGNQYWTDVAYSGSRYVVVSHSQHTMYSDDGLTWVSVSHAVDSDFEAVAYGNGIFVAVSSDLAAHEAVFSTDNGLTWAEADFTTPAGIWADVAFGNGVFCAVSATATK